ncbi:unnamed protein product [marine sediment metagenome]|uniref:Uncharacterized protein n=1 Tax=marine sediment metagenome TaxID=412755 RepID=X1G8R9_9ZZZZ
MTNEEFLDKLKDYIKRVDTDPDYDKYIVDDVETLVEDFREEE